MILYHLDTLEYKDGEEQNRLGEKYGMPGLS